MGPTGSLPLKLIQRVSDMPSPTSVTVITLPSPPSASSSVTSAYGRMGDVVSQEGDYVIDQLGDVDTSTTTPDTDNLLSWDGTNWTPDSTVDSGTFA